MSTSGSYTPTALGCNIKIPKQFTKDKTATATINTTIITVIKVLYKKN